VLLRPERNGFIYVMDRETGEVLSADPFGLVTWAERHRPGDRPARQERGNGHGQPDGA
jgi:glucose dehydrogenase